MNKFRNVTENKILLIYRNVTDIQMKDFSDRYTTDLLGDPPRRGRPRKVGAKSAAERMRDYRARLRSEPVESPGALGDMGEWFIDCLMTYPEYQGLDRVEVIVMALSEARRLRLCAEIGITSPVGGSMKNLQPLYRDRPKKKGRGESPLVGLP